MKRILPLALVASSLALVPAAAQAAPKPKAEILGVVQVDGDTATVRARYVCNESNHLWISAKQTADGRRDAILEQEGSSQHAANWMDSNDWGATGPVSDAGDFDCDGRSHTDTFTIGTASVPWAAPDRYGALEKGSAWVQFCLTEEEDPEGEFIMAARWAQVK